MHLPQRQGRRRRRGRDVAAYDARHAEEDAQDPRPDAGDRRERFGQGDPAARQAGRHQQGDRQAAHRLCARRTLDATDGAALKSSIKKNTHNTSLPASVLANHKGHTVVIHQNATADSATTRAVLDIKQSIEDALNAVAAAEKGMNKATKAELQACLSAIMSGGGLPSGYSCITQSGSTQKGLTSTLNTILEQVRAAPCTAEC